MSYANQAFMNRVGRLSPVIRWVRIAVLSGLLYLTTIPSLSAEATLEPVVGDDEMVMVPKKMLIQFQIDATMILQQRDEAIQELKKAADFLATGKSCS